MTSPVILPNLIGTAGSKASKEYGFPIHMFRNMIHKEPKQSKS